MKIIKERFQNMHRKYKQTTNAQILTNHYATTLEVCHIFYAGPLVKFQVFFFSFQETEAQ